MARKSCDSAVSQPPPADLASPGPPMYVVNRKGEREAVLFDKILTRIAKLSFGLHPLVDPATVAKNVIKGMFPGIKTTELDDLAAQTCAYMAGTHPDFSRLAARIAISNLHKNTLDSFQEVVRQLRNCTDVLGNPAPLIAADVYSFIMEVGDTLDDAIDFSRDFEYDYFAFKTLERSYLLRVDNKIVERPQHMLMRVACGIHCGSLPSVLETYRLLSQRYFTHATPTLFNAGTPNPQMSSCFLLTIKDDSINGIYDTLKDCALISKTAGGIGLAIHKIRATGSYISGTNGRSNGIVPMLKVFNATARYVDQGGGKRKGSFAIYLEPWHADIMEFLDLRKNHGSEDLRARDLFYALWIPDLFMKRVKNDEEWSLFCPHEAPGLADCWGKEFEALYHQYEAEGRARSAVRAQTLWFSILQSQIETGTPYLLYKDACNRKSNQQNLGTIQCSNLCTEIVEYTAPDEIAVCNLASLALPNFVTAATPENYAHNADSCVNEGHVTSASDVNNNNEASASDVNNNNEASTFAEEPWCNSADSDDIENGNLCFDYKALYRVTKVVARNLNRIIDRNQYPVPEARRSNLRHRPIGIGVQGLADVLQLLRLPYDSSEARKVNRLVFETIYYAAVETSVELAQQEGPYSTYEGSPASKGLLQFDLWNQERAERGLPPVLLSGMWDWEALRQKMRQYGLRNSLLVAPMPTASTSQLLGNNESFEPYTSNIYCRRVLSGEFFVVNPHLLRDLLRLNLWNERLRQTLIAANGSVQSIPEIPASLKALYKTVWEIKQKAVLDMAADRGPFIDQSQSLNLHVTQPTYAKLSSMHFYSWDLGLKTGQYYLRILAAADAIKFTIDKSVVQGTTLPKNSTIPPAVPSTTSVLRQSEKTAVEKNTDPPALLTNRTICALEQKAQESVYPPMGYTKNVPHNVNSPATHVFSQPVVCPLRRPGVPYSDNDVCEACSG